MALYPRRVDVKGSFEELSSFFTIVHILQFRELFLLSDGVVRGGKNGGTLFDQVE